MITVDARTVGVGGNVLEPLRSSHAASYQLVGRWFRAVLPGICFSVSVRFGIIFWEFCCPAYRFLCFSAFPRFFASPFLCFLKPKKDYIYKENLYNSTLNKLERPTPQKK